MSVSSYQLQTKKGAWRGRQHSKPFRQEAPLAGDLRGWRGWKCLGAGGAQEARRRPCRRPGTWEWSRTGPSATSLGGRWCSVPPDVRRFPLIVCRCSRRALLKTRFWPRALPAVTGHESHGAPGPPAFLPGSLLRWPLLPPSLCPLSWGLHVSRLCPPRPFPPGLRWCFCLCPDLPPMLKKDIKSGDESKFAAHFISYLVSFRRVTQCREVSESAGESFCVYC